MRMSFLFLVFWGHFSCAPVLPFQRSCKLLFNGAKKQTVERTHFSFVSYVRLSPYVRLLLSLCVCLCVYGEKMLVYVLCERVNFFPSSTYFTLPKHVSHAITIYLCANIDISFRMCHWSSSFRVCRDLCERMMWKRRDEIVLVLLLYLFVFVFFFLLSVPVFFALCRSRILCYCCCCCCYCCWSPSCCQFFFRILFFLFRISFIWFSSLEVCSRYVVLMLSIFLTFERQIRAQP